MVPSRRRGWPHRRPRLDPRSRVGTDGTDRPRRLNSTFVEGGLGWKEGGVETEGVYPEDRPGLAGEQEGDVVEKRREEDVAEVATAFHPTSPFFGREHAMAHRGGSMPRPRHLDPWHTDGGVVRAQRHPVEWVHGMDHHLPTSTHPRIPGCATILSTPSPSSRRCHPRAAMAELRPSPPSHQVHLGPAPVAPFLHVHLGLVSMNTIVNSRWRRSFERR